MINGRYELYVAAPKSEPIWRLLSTCCMFRLNYGTYLDWIFYLTFSLVQASTGFWRFSTNENENDLQLISCISGYCLRAFLHMPSRT
jgi:hypothetical protein